jgi:carbonic anhydrase
MADLRKDIPASIAVALVAIPLCLGIAHASGAPLLSGLLGGIIGGLVVGGLSGSHLSVSGPAAGLTTIVLGAISTLKSFPAFLTAVALAGVLQLIFGKLRLGGLSRLFPSPVIKGMLGAIGLILIMKQFPHLVGYDFESMGVQEFSDKTQDLEDDYPDAPKTGVNTATLVAMAFTHLEPGAMMIGLLSLATLYLWEWKVQKRLPTVPGSLVAVGLGVGLNQLLGLLKPEFMVTGKHLVKIPELGTGLITFPDWSALANPQVYVIAVTIAIIASVETLLCVEALDRLDPEHRFTPPNRELVAQGAGNLLCGLIGAVPVTSVIVRGSVNLSAGATSKISAISHGIVILLSLLIFRGGLNQIPLAALAAVLVHVGAKMAHPSTLRRMMGRGWSQVIPCVVTTLAILFSDLLIGIIIGTLVSAVFILRNLHVAQGLTVTRRGALTQIKLQQEVTFFHKVRLGSILESLEPDTVVEIDGSAALSIDHDVLDVIEVFCQRAPQRNIKVIIGGIATMASFSEQQKAQMQAEYDQLLEKNRAWVEECQQKDPDFFQRTSSGPKPHFLFIGCSDCGVSADIITATEPGKLLVHRNIGNMVSLHDMNLMSVLQYTVEHLVVPHIIVCGHYNCGGIRAALSTDSFGLIDNWVHPVKSVLQENQTELAQILDPVQRERRIIELHVLQQVGHLLKTAVVQNSIQKLGIPRVHAWVYDETTGKIKDLKSELSLSADVHPAFHFQYPFQKTPNAEAGKH